MKIRLRPFALLSALVLMASYPISCLADEEVLLELPDAESFGSGASVSDDLYSPGGVPNVGLYAGEPNNQVRKDRVLLRYDLTPLLLSADRIKSAELKFTIDYYGTPDPKTNVEVEYFVDQIDTLNGQQLNRRDGESIGVVELVGEDAAYNKPNGKQGPPVEKVLDVTSTVKAGLEAGLTAIVFRLKLPDIESNPHTVDSNGIVFTSDQGRRPVLQVILKD